MKKSADENSSTKCFSGILRRLWCTGSLQTHPSDQFIEKEKDDDQTTLDNVKHLAASPGVVARLMGLDSFPNTPRERTLGSYFRSRSVNSIDFLDPTRIGNHRRVRTSVSFRENDDYGPVLRLEKVDEYDHQEELMIRRRPKVNLMEKKVSIKKKLETFQKKDFHGKTRSVNLKESRRPNIKPLDSKEALIESKRVKKKKILAHHSQCSLKKVHPENNLSETAAGVSWHREVKAIMKGKSKSQKMERGYYKRMVEEMAEEDVVKENFVLSSDQNFEEICQQFGQEIVQLLLKQLVDELVGLRSN